MSAAIDRWHLITGEYPPRLGGVSDYTRAVAAGLALNGCDVHVWCPDSGKPPLDPGVTVHPVDEMPSVRDADLKARAFELDVNLARALGGGFVDNAAVSLSAVPAATTPR